MLFRSKFIIVSFIFVVLWTPMRVWAYFSPVSSSESILLAKLADDQMLPESLQSRAVPLFAWSNNFQSSRYFRLNNVASWEIPGISRAFTVLQPDRITRVETLNLSDPGFTQDSNNPDKQWGLVKAGFLEAWERTIGSEDIVVAVLDTGVDISHVDLQTINFVPGWDFVNKRAITNAESSDDHGHGTLVAGILGASPNNGTGIVGGSWQVSLMPVKVLDKTGSGLSSTVAEGIVWAVDHGANIINLSLGGLGLGLDELLSQAVHYAVSKDVLVIAAAGNDKIDQGVNLDKDPGYPACSDNDSNMVIGVTALDYQDKKPPFANFGKNCIDVSAPGKRILSTINIDPLTGKYSPNSYAYASGTSLSVPFVSAEAVLLWSLNPKASSGQIRDHILKHTTSVDSKNPKECAGQSCQGLIGAGRIDVLSAIQNPVPLMSIENGDVVRVIESNTVFYLNGGRKQPVSDFVLRQRFIKSNVKLVNEKLIKDIPQGSYALPKDLSLIKSPVSPTVYMVKSGQKQPISASVFMARKYNFKDVSEISSTEIDSYLTGKFLAPPEGALVRGVKNPTVYWVIGNELHPINEKYYLEKGLRIFPIMYLPDEEIVSYQLGRALVL